MGAVYRKELRIYFCGMLGWLIAAILLLFGGLFTAAFHLMSGNTDFSPVLIAMQWVLIVAVPFLTMRSIAEERHSRTDQLLYSLPMPMRQVVLGKFFAMLTVFLLPTAVMAIYPLILSGFGEISLASAYTALFGYVLLGASLIALCTFLSSLVENQALAAVISIACLLLLYLFKTVSGLLPASELGSFLICVIAALGVSALIWRVTRNLNLGLAVAATVLILATAVYLIKASLFRSLVPDFLNAIDVFSRFTGFSYGHFDVTGTVFYLSFTAFFLFLTVRTMEKRRLM